MRIKSLLLCTLTAGSLMFSGIAAAEPDAAPAEQLTFPLYSAQQELNRVLLQQILTELKVSNDQKAESASLNSAQQEMNRSLLQQIHNEMKGTATVTDTRCWDGQSPFSPGFVITRGENTLRCTLHNGIPEWVGVKP